MAKQKRHDDEIDVDDALVRALLREQFPEWADLPMEIVEPSGTDHTIYSLGDEMVVRMPIMEYCTKQAGKEARWLPVLAPHLPLAVPVPIAMGQPGAGYPFRWSIVPWIEGERATKDNLDLPRAAVDLAAFIRALQAIDATDGPGAGQHTGFRGKSIRPGAAHVRDVATKAQDYDTTKAVAVWDVAVAADEWSGPPVWFHGDLAGNLIARDGHLVGAIDSGYGTGDPACDLMPGWTIFSGDDRATFFDAVGLDEATKLRARGWAVGPALTGLSYYKDVPHLYESSRNAIEAATAD